MFRRTLLLLALGLLGAGLCKADYKPLKGFTAQPEWKETPAEAVQWNPGTKIVKVFAELPEGTSQGSGWFINNHTLITDYHVVEGADQIEIEYADGQTSEATVRNYSAACDVAALDVTTVRPDQTWARITADSDQVYPNETVTAYGYPQGEWAVTSGTLVARYADRTGTKAVGWFSTDLLLDHGSSGGPVEDSQGRVIGVAEAISRPDSPYHCFITSANVIWEALGLTSTASHPNGFKTGVTRGVNLNQ
jgi:S1-C subfamily serine protease